VTILQVPGTTVLCTPHHPRTATTNTFEVSNSYFFYGTHPI